MVFPIREDIMDRKDAERYIENLEGIIISREKLLDRFRKKAHLADIFLSFNPTIELLSQWSISALKELSNTTATRAKVRETEKDRRRRHESSIRKDTIAQGENGPDRETEVRYPRKLVEQILFYNLLSRRLIDNARNDRWIGTTAESGCDISRVIKAWGERFNEHPARKGILDLKITLDRRNPIIEAHDAELFALIDNLATNSIEALEGRENPLLVIGTELRGNHVIIKVSDNGPGIPEGIGERIFKPYFSMKKNAGGETHPGLGLYASWNIVTSLDGTIGFDSEPESNTTFTVSLPLSKRFKKIIAITEREMPSAKRGQR